MSDGPSLNAQTQREIQRLLARAPVVAGRCELDLLVFFYRHPRSILTNEQLAAMVGYDTRQIAQAIEAFIDAGLLERTQNTMHAARMYVLLLEGPRMGGLKSLLEMASTYAGRMEILQGLAPRCSRPPAEYSGVKRKLRSIA
ncbi:MAG TPA: hypothetical protein VFW83_06975 [Bryobacteraceae bacterium]|nr:hypothetical protein [Bryobacteraceae bacterium]